MPSVLDQDSRVPGMARGLGEFRLAMRALPGDPRGRVRVFQQVLDAATFTVAFEPGSPTHQALANDQNRFTPPRSLPPILGLDLPDEEDNESGGYVITRYAYSEGAYRLLEDLLRDGYVLEMNEFSELAWSLAQALAWLHGLDIVHGQWNARSVIALPANERPHPFLDSPAHRFEVLDTGVCFAHGAVPREYVERGYYPPEVFLASDDQPDYRALDVAGDVYCFAAFLKDLMQRACSTEELPSQASRILEALQREAQRRGWKAAPERLRQKELEILDHLYTIKVRTESLIQEGLRPREQRSPASRILQAAEDLHARASRYLEDLFAHGFEPVNAFGDDLQHYTTFDLRVSPQRINSFDDGRVVLTGIDLPHELVRVTLDERHEGVRVVAARPDRIEFSVDYGFPAGQYRISINNRRTNGTLEVEVPEWRALEPAELYQPWEGFGNLRVRVRGARLPARGQYELRAADHDGSAIAAVVVMTDDRTVVEPGNDAASSSDTLDLTFPCDTPPDDYELFVNGIGTGLPLRVRPQLPVPAVPIGGVEPARIRNHRETELQLRGRNFHPHMVVALGDVDAAGIELLVESATTARLTVPAHFPAGRHRLRVNHEIGEAELEVLEPRWSAIHPPAVKVPRQRTEPFAIDVTGEELPPLEGADYTLRSPDGTRQPNAVVAADEAEPNRAHRLLISPDVPRGAHGLAFGDADTGLRLRVRRQASRAVVASAAAAVLIALAAGGFLASRMLAPTIDAFHPNVVACLGAPSLHLQGAHVDAIDLLDGDKVLATLPVAEDDSEAGSYAVPLSGVAPGRYAVRPRSDLLGAGTVAGTLEVRLPALHLQPSIVDRLRPAALRLAADDDFDVSALKELTLRGGNGAERQFTLQAGVATLPTGTFTAADEGVFGVALDGVTLPEGSPAGRVEVFGPRVRRLSPNPVVADDEGHIDLQMAGSHLQPDGELVLLPIPDDDDAAPTPAAAPAPAIPLQHLTGAHYAATATPGRYRLAIRDDARGAEPLALPPLVVLAAPAIAEVEPRRVEPGQVVTFTARGVNLGALDHVVLQPLQSGAAPIEVPWTSEKGSVSAQDAVLDFDATLPSGSYRLQPAAADLTIEVFDDCTRALAGYRESGTAADLLACLDSGRPSLETLHGAADLLFDRGELLAAAKIYGRLDGIQAAFRHDFAIVFVGGEAADFMAVDEDDAQTPYGIAAGLLRWSNGSGGTLPEDASLPWELDYVRGTLAADPQTAVQAFTRSIAKKAAASAGHESTPFLPAQQALAVAKLDLAIDLLARGSLREARDELLDAVVGDAATWQALPAAQQARARLWQGHLQLWLGADEAGARETLAAAAQDGGIDGALARRYLAALDGHDADEPVGDGWMDAFVSVLRFQREIVASPNYNILTEERGTGVYLTADERSKSERLQAALTRLEALRPLDPLAHHAITFYLRNAQRLSWPTQDGGKLADEHRARLLALDLDGPIAAARDYYLLLGDLGPFDVPQILVMSRDERADRAKRAADLLQAEALPAAFRHGAEALRKRFLGPSVLWKTQ